ncbi:MAG: hypothetical protein Q4F27_06300, partial [Desulfovibrionaceae bacterium]|nr:hypothetical protein [Desulfovibrionaceae bacterium]
MKKITQRGYDLEKLKKVINALLQDKRPLPEE